MSTILRGHGNVLLGIGAGIAIGACATLALQHLTSSLDQKLASLVSTIEALQREVQNLNTKLQQAEKLTRNKESFSRKKGFSSVHQSDNEDEDDDEFEDTIDEAEFEKLQTWSQQQQQKKNDQLQSSQVAETGSYSTQEAQKLFAQVDKLMEGTDIEKEQALNILRTKHLQYSNDANFLWRLCKANHQNAGICQAKGLEDKRKELAFKAVDLIRQALAINGNIAQVHKWYAITLGTLNDYLGTQEKIKNGYTFKEHIEKAISLDPTDSSNYYLLGRWCYGVYMLTWLERKAAATLFATPPSSTVEEALDKFLKAEDLAEKPWKENKLFIAKCYLEQRNYASAASWLNKANEIPARSVDDKAAQKEVESLIAKYGRYAQ